MQDVLPDLLRQGLSLVVWGVGRPQIKDATVHGRFVSADVQALATSLIVHECSLNMTSILVNDTTSTLSFTVFKEAFIHSTFFPSHSAISVRPKFFIDLAVICYASSPGIKGGFKLRIKDIRSKLIPPFLRGLTTDAWWRSHNTIYRWIGLRHLCGCWWCLFHWGLFGHWLPIVLRQWLLHRLRRRHRHSQLLLRKHRHWVLLGHLGRLHCGLH